MDQKIPHTLLAKHFVNQTSVEESEEVRRWRANHLRMKNCTRNIYMNGKLHMLIFPGSCYQIVIRCGETYCPGSMNLLKQYYILRRNFIKPLLLQLQLLYWLDFLFLSGFLLITVRMEIIWLRRLYLLFLPDKNPSLYCLMERKFG